MKEYNKIIQPPGKFSFINFKEIIQYKDVLRALVEKDFKVQYVQTFLGYGWALINPIATMLILTLVFGKIGRIDSGTIPFMLFAMAGTVSWNYIASVISESGRAVFSSRDLIGKVYFPRIILPLSKAIVGLVELGVSLVCLFVLMIILDFVPSPNMIWSPIFLMLIIISGLGIGIWIAALSILYRDIFYAIPFVLRLGMFVTPAAFPYSAIPEQYRTLVYLNPLAAPVDGFRWSLLGGEINKNLLLISLSVNLLLLVSGLWYFKRVEHKFADAI